MALPDFLIAEYERLINELSNRLVFLEAKNALRAEKSEPEKWAAAVTLERAKRDIAEIEDLLKAADAVGVFNLTELKYIANFSTERIRFDDYEHQRFYTIDPAPEPGIGVMQSVNTNVPWVVWPSDYPNHHWGLGVRETPMIWYSIWQSKEDDGDFVRANLGGGWKEHAPPIPGLAAVDGQRWLAINPDHSIELIDYNRRGSPAKHA